MLHANISKQEKTWKARDLTQDVYKRQDISGSNIERTGTVDGESRWKVGSEDVYKRQIVLFMNGVGTLLFIAVTKGQAPAYLGSSFAFLAPAGIVISKLGYEYALGGFVEMCIRDSVCSGSILCCQ